MDANPFDEKDPKTESADKNAPIALPFDEGDQQGQGVTVAKSDRVLWYTIGGITLSACIVMILITFSLYNSVRSQVSEVFAPPSTPRPAITPNLTATQGAWVKPSQSPTFGSAEEALQTNEADSVDYLYQRAIDIPFQPDINQPGDVYVYEVLLNESESLLWSYGWCTTTKQILNENFAQMKIEFFVNGVPVSKEYIGVYDFARSEDSGGGACRSHITLITDWPPGDHQLEIRVTFLIPTDDGWNVYPAGTHIFKYFVNVKD